MPACPHLPAGLTGRKQKISETQLSPISRSHWRELMAMLAAGRPGKQVSVSCLFSSVSPVEP